MPAGDNGRLRKITGRTPTQPHRNAVFALRSPFVPFAFHALATVLRIIPDGAEKGKDEPLAELGVAPSTDGKSGTHGTTTPSH